MGSSVRRRPIFLIFAGLSVTMGFIVPYRYYLKRTLFDAVRRQAKLAPSLPTEEFSGIYSRAKNFIQMQELIIINIEGRKLIRTERGTPFWPPC